MLLLSWLDSFLCVVKLDRVSCSAEFLSPWTNRSPEGLGCKVFGTEAARGAQPQASTERVSTPCAQGLQGYSPQKAIGTESAEQDTRAIQPTKVASQDGSSAATAQASAAATAANPRAAGRANRSLLFRARET